MTRRTPRKRPAEAPDPPQKEPRGRLVTVEEGVRLSASCIWDLQRAFFAQQDPRAWSRGRVPSYVTSNAFMARAATRVVGGFLEDAAAGRLGPIDPRSPLHVLELGAGSGRFAYGVLRELAARTRSAARPGPEARYVITDFHPGPLQALRSNPRFQLFVKRGLLDFAVVDAEAPGDVALLESGETLRASRGANPLVAVANYVLDGIRADAFEVRDGVLFENLVRIRCPPQVDPKDPASLPRLLVSFAPAPLGSSPCGDPELDALLRSLAARLPDGAFLFPTSALRLARHLRSLGGGRLLFLAADRGHVHEAALHGLDAPVLMRHGSVSLDVNFHALAAQARASEGLALLPPHHPTHLATIGLLWGCADADASRAARAYREHFASGGPEDLYLLKETIERAPGRLDIEHGLAWLRASAMDPEVFLSCAPGFLDGVDEAGPTVREDLLDAARRVCEAYFPVAGDADVLLALAELLQALDALPEAAALCEESLRLHGRNPENLHRLATCVVGLGRAGEAKALLDEALALAPRYEPARAMRRTLAGGPRRSAKQR
jgi:tetratricopeptide (TPR) repeat protein